MARRRHAGMRRVHPFPRLNEKKKLIPSPASMKRKAYRRADMEIEVELRGAVRGVGLVHLVGEEEGEGTRLLGQERRLAAVCKSGRKVGSSGVCVCGGE